jgi:hypothetical protein
MSQIPSAGTRVYAENSPWHQGHFSRNSRSHRVCVKKYEDGAPELVSSGHIARKPAGIAVTAVHEVQTCGPACVLTGNARCVDEPAPVLFKISHPSLRRHISGLPAMGGIGIASSPVECKWRGMQEESVQAGKATKKARGSIPTAASPITTRRRFSYDSFASTPGGARQPRALFGAISRLLDLRLPKMHFTSPTARQIGKSVGAR